LADAAPLLSELPSRREHFLEAQRRHRLASGPAALFSAAAATLSGIPLSALITPILLAPAIVIGLVLAHVALLPPPVLAWLSDAAHLVPTVWAALWGRANLSWTLIGVLAAPGAVAALLGWMGVLRLRRAWSGAALHRLGARPPDVTQPSERRFDNLVQELAVAAGAPAPRTLVIDGEAANALAVGLRLDDAAFVATSGFLERLSRDEQQAYLAHLVGSVANGDLRIAASLLSVFQTWGFISVIGETPFSGEARRALGRTLAVMAGVGRWDQAAAEQVLDRLMAGAGQEYAGLNAYLDGVERRHSLARNVFIDLPLLIFGCIGSITVTAATGLAALLVFGPAMSALWRSRRRLADATAVELTRNPDALLGALERLRGADVVPKGAAPLSFLFPVWGKDVADRTDIVGQVVGLHLEPAPRHAALERLGALYRGEANPTPRKPLAEQARAAARFAGWFAIALALVGVLFVVSLVAMGLVLWAVWAGMSALLALV
jgi:Zn-dependent protease with chaperone function